ncbi:MAG: flagellar basal body P-ring protein FlgI [Planctomycetota bacterium]
MKKTLLILVNFFAVYAIGLTVGAQQLEPIQPLADQTTSPNQGALPPPSIPRFLPSYQLDYRIRDITFPDGDRENEISGIGLVVGLSQTGGRAAQTQVMAQNFYQRNGLNLEDGPETRAMSSVWVRASVPPYARKGEKIQVTVSVMDDATSLRGGTLIQTPLKGIDGKIYAIAQGSVLGGGVAAGGAAANVQRDHPTVGVCTAILEQEICTEPPDQQNKLRLILRNKEYTTAVSIANTLNSVFPNTAMALDHGAVEILIPPTFRNKRPSFIAAIGNLRVKVDPTAKVVINQKTGTIVMGQNVRIAPVTVANGSLVISTTETPVVSQPAPLSDGQTVVLPRTDLSVTESGGPYTPLGGTATVGDLGRALNELGFTPNMMIEMFSSLKSQGALQAELIIE